jgi:Tol biopolymer transport system component
VGFNGEIQETLTSARAGFLNFALSPDGRMLAYTSDQADGGPANDLWIRDLERGVEFQAASAENQSFFEVSWSRDGQHVFFVAVELPDGASETVRISVDGTEPWTVVATEPGNLTPAGDQIVFVTGPRGEPLSSGEPDTTEIWIQSLAEPETRRRVLGGDAAYFPVGVSPGGTYLLYYAMRGGSESTYLTRFPEFTGRWKVSLGTEVRAEDFAPDGSAIYYVSDDDLFRVAFAEGPTPELGRPERVSALPVGSLGGLQIHPDGDSYLTVVDAQSQDGNERQRRVKVVQHWVSKLGHR